MKDSRQHSLFQSFPLTEERSISTGKVPVRYHVYNGHGLLVGGTAGLAAIRKRIASEDVLPVETTNGEALMGIWVCEFTDANLGPHTELQFSVLVSRQAISPVSSSPHALLKTLYSNPDVKMLTLAIWNNAEMAVVYNQEVAGLNAALCVSAISRRGKRKKFRFASANGDPILEGNVSEARLSAFWTVAQLMRTLGIGTVLRSITQPYIGTGIVNTKGNGFSENLEARALLSSGKTVVQPFDYREDALVFRTNEYAALGFQPSFLEHFSPFRFVYLPPAGGFQQDQS